MILADKIIELRKRSGWSQEELAEQLDVSRQSVSKWEGAQSVPDLDKILKLSEVFGVSTDYLLKDELEDAGSLSADVGTRLRRVTMAQAAEFLNIRKSAAPKMALGVFLCAVSPICLILLGAASELPGSGISEDAAGGIGMCVLLALIAAAVGLYWLCGARSGILSFSRKSRLSGNTAWRVWYASGRRRSKARSTL
ncbi:MAG: helix-turn-helix domain-containing protein [Bacteroides sp.]|nr:helix-turn-helix domain-containing protein [Eubacterium sp.]MCM1419452.1 helix-turn-helix domain-containing protein [Roseburia sp.]MCM1463280.1 helix-turn-helix domain-containing protein [Bacteroides sp.]